MSHPNRVRVVSGEEGVITQSTKALTVCRQPPTELSVDACMITLTPLPCRPSGVYWCYGHFLEAAEGLRV